MSALIASLGVAASVAAVTIARGADLAATAGNAAPPPAVTAVATPASAAAPSPSAPSPVPTVSYPVQGPGTYRVLPGGGPVIGRTGTLLRFTIAVENGIVNLDTAAFAAFVDRTYGDPRGWTAGGAWRFQRVGPGQDHDFTLYLVTPGTRDVLCHDTRDRYTSCRNGDSVVLNVARWTHGVPHYGAPLDTYRTSALNHETGHRLGLGHELCPGPGRPAPVMQQQTLGLHGCVANPWPYVDGRRYTGPPGAYADPIPPA